MSSGAMLCCLQHPFACNHVTACLLRECHVACVTPSKGRRRRWRSCNAEHNHRPPCQRNRDADALLVFSSQRACYYYRPYAVKPRPTATGFKTGSIHSLFRDTASRRFASKGSCCWLRWMAANRRGAAHIPLAIIAQTFWAF